MVRKTALRDVSGGLSDTVPGQHAGNLFVCKGSQVLTGLPHGFPGQTPDQHAHTAQKRTVSQDTVVNCPD